MSESPSRLAKKLDDEFTDIRSLSERSLRKLWLNENDEIWSQYLGEGK